jgi:hypothetical protein
MSGLPGNPEKIFGILDRTDGKAAGVCAERTEHPAPIDESELKRLQPVWKILKLSGTFAVIQTI